MILVARIEEFESSNKLTVRLGNAEILLVKLEEGVKAVQRRCPHQGFDLAEARIVGSVIICPRHNCPFDLLNPEKALCPWKAHHYLVTIVDGFIYVSTKENLELA